MQINKFNSADSKWDQSLPKGREKRYGKWWDLLFPLVASRESADPSNIVEPPFYNDNQNTDPENDLGGSENATAEKKCECKPKKNKETI